jgi:hypothetical protein
MLHTNHHMTLRLYHSHHSLQNKSSVEHFLPQTYYEATIVDSNGGPASLLAGGGSRGRTQQVPMVIPAGRDMSRTQQRKNMN